MRRPILFVLFLVLGACSTPKLVSRYDYDHEQLTCSGEFVEVYPGCAIADVVGGGALAFDCIIVRLVEPSEFASRRISLMFDRGTSLPTIAKGSEIEFTAQRHDLADGTLGARPLKITARAK